MAKRDYNNCFVEMRKIERKHELVLSTEPQDITR